jgi:hypothetical protein
MTSPGAEPRAVDGAGPAPRLEEAALWAAFSSAPAGDIAAAWLDLARRRLGPVPAMALFGGLQEAPVPEAVWPQGFVPDESMRTAVAEGLAQGLPLVRSSPRGFILVCPLLQEQQVVAVEAAAASPQDLQRLLDELLWTSGWLAARLAARRAERSEVRAQQVELAARLAENMARETAAPAAARALAAGLGASFRCSEVRVGVSRRGRLTMAARWPEPDSDAEDDAAALAGESHRQEVLAAAVLAGRALSIPLAPPEDEAEARAALAVAGDDPATTGLPPQGDASANAGGDAATAGDTVDSGPLQEADAEADAAEGQAQAPARTPGPIESLSRTSALCAVPLILAEGAAGAVLLERIVGPAFSDEEVAALDAIALQAAPLLESRPMGRPQVTTERRAFVALFGPVRLRFKLALVALLAMALVLTGATGEYAVPATAVMEGAPPRAVSAPFKGVLAELAVRRGDTVKRGQLLARMDDRELQLERLRLGAARDHLAQVVREARELRDTGASGALGTKLQEVEASLRTVEERLSRLRIVSPVDGVVSGGQGFGFADGPVEQGQALLEISPVDTYRLVLWVDERNLPFLREGQSGRVDFGAGEPVPITIKRLTGVTAPVKGASRVRVEAQLQAMSEHAVPGAEGSAEVGVGKRKMVWIWWRSFQREIANW